MKKSYIFYTSIVFILSIFLTYELKDRPSLKVSSQLSAIEWYAHARSLTVNQSVDPPCSQSKDIYICAGHCPWHNTPNRELLSCSFLPRIPNSDFVKHKIYCIPDPDQCPTYNSWLKDSLPPTRHRLKIIPHNLLSNFTLNYTIPVDYSYQEFRAGDSLPENWTVGTIESYRRQVRAKAAFGTYNNKDIYPALEKYCRLAIQNKNCAVIGTINPWIEAALLEYNASSVTTIEYATIRSSVPRLYTITPMDFARRQENDASQRQIFDSVWSYSSLEHDGLGRYRDPLNPYGDLQTMIKISCILKPGGLLFLSVPLHVKDYLQFNLHRLYGPIRLPFLYRHFHIVEVLGTGMATIPRSFGAQPFVVLQNKVGCKQT